jgi:hypothetical protein
MTESEFPKRGYNPTAFVQYLREIQPEDQPYWALNLTLPNKDIHRMLEEHRCAEVLAAHSAILGPKPEK